MPKQNRQPGIHLHKTKYPNQVTGKLEWYWILIANNGKTIARSSETYKTKRSAVYSIVIAEEIFDSKGYYYDHTNGGTGVEEVTIKLK